MILTRARQVFQSIATKTHSVLPKLRTRDCRQNPDHRAVDVGRATCRALNCDFIFNFVSRLTFYYFTLPFILRCHAYFQVCISCWRFPTIIFYLYEHERLMGGRVNNPFSKKNIRWLLWTTVPCTSPYL